MEADPVVMPTCTYKHRDGIFRMHLFLEPYLDPRRVPWRASFANNEPKVCVSALFFLRPLEGKCSLDDSSECKEFYSPSFLVKYLLNRSTHMFINKQKKITNSQEAIRQTRKAQTQTQMVQLKSSGESLEFCL